MTTNGASTRVTFREGFVEAAGFRVRYLEAGEGDPLVVLHGGGGLRHYTTHDLLAQTRRVILIEAPGFGDSPPNDRSQSMAELADAVAAAVQALGIDSYDLQGTSFGGKLALWLAVQYPERLRSLVLIGPAAIRPESNPLANRDQLRFYAHPERQGPIPQAAPEVREKHMALARRVMGPARDEALESRMRQLNLPVLVVFGTLDNVTPPELGRHYREVLPNGHVVFLYDAAHEADADRPEAFVELANDFRDRHEAFIVTTKSGLLHP
jgi:pimeloyl-ACP methyl ester carboxylesterase